MHETSEWLHGPHLGGLGLDKKEQFIEQTLNSLRDKYRQPEGNREVLDELIIHLRDIATHTDVMHVYSAIVIRLGLESTLIELRRNHMGRTTPNEDLHFIINEVNTKEHLILQALFRE